MHMQPVVLKSQKQRPPTYGEESDMDDEDRALISEDKPLMPPIPPFQPHQHATAHMTQRQLRNSSLLCMSNCLVKNNNKPFNAPFWIAGCANTRIKTFI